MQPKRPLNSRLAAPFRCPVRLDTLLAWAAEVLLQVPEETDPKGLAHTFWRRCTGQLTVDGSTTIEVEQSAKYCDWVQRFVAGEPLAYIEGLQGFWTLDLEVTPDVLIPRPDSECLVESALVYAKDNSVSRVLDLGVGSGCLLLSVLSELPHAHGVGVDLSDAALKVAQRNAKRLGLNQRTTWHRGSWFDCLAHSERYDLILSNPPYIEPSEFTGHSVSQSEPHLALFTPMDDPMFAYREICSRMTEFLTEPGLAILEVGDGRGDELAALAESYNLQVVGRRNDLSGTERVLLLQVKRD